MNAFKISRLLAPRYYKVLEITKEIPFDVQPNCPCDRSPLKTFCTFLGNEGRDKIRVGVCDACGYVGYIDRPGGDWIRNYYSTTWDAGEESESRIEAETKEYAAKKGSLNPIKLTEEEVLNLGISKDRYLLEIGSGRDLVPKALAKLGYGKIMAVDPSKPRARISEQAFGIKVVAEPFESEKAQAEFRKNAPFGLIFSSHVLEHTYDPGEIIRLAASLQNNGDYLALAFPNIHRERAGIILLFLPHLHSLSPDSLKNLLESNGYEIIKSARAEGNHAVLAKKTGERKESPATSGHIQSTLARFIKEIGLDKTYSSKSRLWWWFKYANHGGQDTLWSKIWPIPLLQYYLYSKIIFRRRFKKELAFSLGEKFAKKPVHYSTIMGAAITDAEKRFTSPGESPIEIQFDGNIKLFYK